MLALSQTSPSEAASRRELIVLLADALADLPEPEAEVLWLYHAEGLSFEAIGERLGLSRKASGASGPRAEGAEEADVGVGGGGFGMDELPGDMLYQGVSVEIAFGERRPSFGDLFRICGDTHPLFPTSGEFGFET